jgi:hypothetical protein
MTTASGNALERDEPLEQHDHAWRTLDRGRQHDVFAEHRCDVCNLAWTLDTRDSIGGFHESEIRHLEEVRPAEVRPG